MSKHPDRKKKKNMLAKLVRRGKVGEHYTPREKIYSGIPKEERGNLELLLDEMHQAGLIEYHKGKNCVSINRWNKDKVKKVLKGKVPDYYWENF
ncbi:MAG: hypothetical protein MUP58_03640 [Candidatus Nanohaloarchaeota archaeon QJJ-9]|nr:hypothetical protein [Candidatus Nanohaloarchaeota archaeon QJJ-9]